MKVFDLKEMKGGWFIGNFEPSLLKTDGFEVSVKRYKAGDVDVQHYHHISIEYTVIVSGTVRMFNEIFTEDAIVRVDPDESTSFEALTDAITAVVKVPCVKNDKYIDGE